MVGKVENCLLRDLLSGLSKWYSNKCGTQCFSVHFHASAAQVIICPRLHVWRLGVKDT